MNFTFVCGTREVKKLPDIRRWHGPVERWGVVCATCGGLKKTFLVRSAAISYAVTTSAQPCRCKGCGAR